MDKLQDEHSNIRKALFYSHRVGKIEDCYKLTVSLCLYWEIRGYYAEAKQWIELLLQKRNALPLHKQAIILQFAGTFSWIKGELLKAKVFHQECLSIMREVGEMRGVAVALNNLGIIENDEGDYDRARVLIEESIEILRDLGDKKELVMH